MSKYDKFTKAQLIDMLKVMEGQIQELTPKSRVSDIATNIFHLETSYLFLTDLSLLIEAIVEEHDVTSCKLVAGVIAVWIWNECEAFLNKKCPENSHYVDGVTDSLLVSMDHISYKKLERCVRFALHLAGETLD